MKYIIKFFERILGYDDEHPRIVKPKPIELPDIIEDQPTTFEEFVEHAKLYEDLVIASSLKDDRKMQCIRYIRFEIETAKNKHDFNLFLNPDKPSIIMVEKNGIVNGIKELYGIELPILGKKGA